MAGSVTVVGSGTVVSTMAGDTVSKGHVVDGEEVHGFIKVVHMSP